MLLGRHGEVLASGGTSGDGDNGQASESGNNDGGGTSGDVTSTSTDREPDDGEGRPSYDKLRKNYPGDEYSSKDVYKMIGGDVAKNYFHNENTGAEANSCALRLSRALNTSGLDINPDLMPNATYWQGADGKSYMMKVAEMQKYLTIVFGQPDIIKITGNTDIKAGDFAGQRGIIDFSVRGWGDATGHLTLFDGNAAVHGSYFQQDLNNEHEYQVKTTKVMLWILK